MNRFALFNPRDFGAAGDGKMLDTAAINLAIAAAHEAGGGTVRFRPGRYLCTSIHLQSNVTLFLEAGVVIEAASERVARYDLPEPNAFDAYQDFGHSHFRNSLLWGENLENVSIVGPGMFDGKGLHSGHEGTNYAVPIPAGGANKTIALKNCRNVVLRDFSMLHGGHFAILATGVDNFTVDNLKIDTNRDAIDVDCCRNVRLSNISVNTPWDDGIVLKSSYALGEARFTENVTIENCFVTAGLVEGTLLDGTFKTSTLEYSPRRYGRIKLGTESNAGFRNIAISNCTFEDCMGLALETVDGGVVENVTVSNIAMRKITNAPIFIRLGSRLRGPNNPMPGAIRHINISNIVVTGSNPRYASIIAGIPNYPVEDVRISNLQILTDGGGTAQQGALAPAENAAAYPDPDMFGDLPAYGFFVRHAKGVEMQDVSIRTAQADARPAFYLEDVDGADFQHVKWEAGAGTREGAAFLLKNVADFTTRLCPAIPDTRLEKVERQGL